MTNVLHEQDIVVDLEFDKAGFSELNLRNAARKLQANSKDPLAKFEYSLIGKYQWSELLFLEIWDTYSAANSSRIGHFLQYKGVGSKLDQIEKEWNTIKQEVTGPTSIMRELFHLILLVREATVENMDSDRLLMVLDKVIGTMEVVRTSEWVRSKELSLLISIIGAANLGMTDRSLDTIKTVLSLLSQLHSRFVHRQRTLQLLAFRPELDRILNG